MGQCRDQFPEPRRAHRLNVLLGTGRGSARETSKIAAGAIGATGRKRTCTISSGSILIFGSACCGSRLCISDLRRGGRWRFSRRSGRDLANRKWSALVRQFRSRGKVNLARSVVRQRVPVRELSSVRVVQSPHGTGEVTPFDAFLPPCPTPFRPPALAARNFRGARPILHCKFR